MNYDANIIGPSSSPETNEITEALSKSHAEMKHVSLDSSNPHFKSRFSSYAECCDTLRGPLTRNGMALPDFRPGLLSGQWVLVGTLRHKNGQWISGIAPLINPKGDMQGFGAAMTYAKRTLLMALCGGFSGEPDDDGNDIQAPKKASESKHVDSKHLSYQQGAINAVNEADSEATAKKVVDLVELRVREKAVPASVHARVKEEFSKRFSKEVQA